MDPPEEEAGGGPGLPWSSTFRFYGDLNHFLPANRRQQAIVRPFRSAASVKDMIEALGVPHPEVALVVVDGEPVGFDHLVTGGERIAAYPRFESVALPAGMRLDPDLPEEPGFVLDRHLGTLARYLRLLGSDAAYRNDYEDEELARTSAREGRVLLTRDVGLLKRSIVERGYCLRENNPRLQAVEVARRFGLGRSATAFRRCLACNALLEPVDRDAVAGRVPPRSWRRHNEFRICPGCGRIYWKGTHYDRLSRLVDELRSAAWGSAGGPGAPGSPGGAEAPGTGPAGGADAPGPAGGSDSGSS